MKFTIVDMQTFFFHRNNTDGTYRATSLFYPSNLSKLLSTVPRQGVDDLNLFHTV